MTKFAPAKLSFLAPSLPSVLMLVSMPLASYAQSAGDVENLQRQVDELQTRVGELSQSNGSTVGTSRSNVRLTFSGRLSAGILFAEQGNQDQTFIADNDASGSRFGFRAEADLNDQVTAGFRFEISAEVNSTDDIDFGFTPGVSDDASDFGDVRHANLYIDTPYGYFSIGQGNTAAEDTAHADLSGTSLAGAGSDVDDIAGGLSFLPASGTDLGSDGDVDAFFDVLDGSRETRFLYRTPEFNGFRFDASFATSDGEDGIDPAIGVFYENEFGDFEFEAAASWREESNGANEDTFIVGAASLLHSSGLNLTIAGGRADIDGQAEDSTSGFVKLGYRDDLFSFGQTRFSVDYFRGENNADFASPAGVLPETESFGISFVQVIDSINTEVFATYRKYSVENAYINGALDEIEDMDVFFIGSRFRF